MTDLDTARRRLSQGDVTCVVCRRGTVRTASKRGVAPLLAWLDGEEPLAGASVADKVVGKAAAFLYVLLGVQAVYAPVMSKPALAVLTAHGITADADLIPDAIRNRDNTGFCPMESAVWDCESPAEALVLIRKTAADLAAKEEKS